MKKTSLDRRLALLEKLVTRKINHAFPRPFRIATNRFVRQNVPRLLVVTAAGSAASAVAVRNWKAVNAEMVTSQADALASFAAGNWGSAATLEMISLAALAFVIAGTLAVGACIPMVNAIRCTNFKQRRAGMVSMRRLMLASVVFSALGILSLPLIAAANTVNYARIEQSQREWPAVTSALSLSRLDAERLLREESMGQWFAEPEDTQSDIVIKTVLHRGTHRSKTAIMRILTRKANGSAGRHTVTGAKV